MALVGVQGGYREDKVEGYLMYRYRMAVSGVVDESKSHPKTSGAEP